MLVIRTDFSDESAWEAVRTAIDGSDEDSYMYGPEYQEDRAYQGISVREILARLPKAIEDPFVAVVDETTITSPEMPVLLVDLHEDDYGETFRIIPAELPSIEVNLSLANMDFFEFAASAGEDGVFRGFGGG